jgi:hypothetical protein
MTVDQSMTLLASDRGALSSRLAWPSVEKITEALGGEADEHAETVPEPIMASSPVTSPGLPVWPRVYPGL